MRTLLALAAAVLTAAALAAPATAHVQVRPTVAAPGDPVLFEVIVPGESDAKTVEVTLQVPKDVLPFSFNDPPGWERRTAKAPTAASRRSSGAASRPPTASRASPSWPRRPSRRATSSGRRCSATTTAQIARWIGAPDSENPAAVTKVTASAPRQNAGGESGEAAAEGASPTPAATVAAAPASAPVAGGRRQPAAADPLDRRRRARRRRAVRRAARPPPRGHLSRGPVPLDGRGRRAVRRARTLMFRRCALQS